jgi:hypothetical protein
MKSYQLSIIIIYCLLFFSSCTSVIQISVPNGTTQLVVDAFLDNSSKPQTVRITTSSNYFSGAPCPAVLGATVSLTDLTNVKTFTFTPDGKGNYIYTPVANDTMGYVNHKYQLNISYSGNTYIALSTIFPTIPVDSITFRSSSTDSYNQFPNDTTKPRTYFPFFFAKDIKGTGNFYWIKAYKNDVFYNQPSQMNICEDAGIAGDGVDIGVSNNFYNLTDSKNPIYRGDTCTIAIYSTDANTNDFLGQLQTQMTNAQAGLFAVTPQNVKTNIQQISGTQPAIGWFNMGAIMSKSVVAR